MDKRLKVLVVYNYMSYPPRITILDHLYSFKNYSMHRVYYLNIAVSSVPKYIKNINFDVIIFHTTFLSNRWNPPSFIRNINKVRLLKGINAVKIALPQDEFIHTKILCDFINEMKIDCVYSVAPETEWKKIYSSVDFEKVKFFNILTGYLDDKTVNRINQLAKANKSRKIDIGYRAWRAAHWLGRHGFLKTRIGDVFQDEASKRGLILDISTKAEDTLLGDKWYIHLLNCKYTIGVEGGATILDADGLIKQKTEAFVAENPEAEFDVVEASCFPGLDGTLNLRAISPRHLEACVTRTCQVLVEGSYNGILEPGKHYIELKKDFSNLDDILEEITNDSKRNEIVNKAYVDIVESGLFTYKKMVEIILQQSFDDEKITLCKYHSNNFKDKYVLLKFKIRDYFSWRIVHAIIFILNARLLKFVKPIWRRMPSPVRKVLNKIVRKVLF